MRALIAIPVRPDVLYFRPKSTILPLVSPAAAVKSVLPVQSFSDLELTKNLQTCMGHGLTVANLKKNMRPSRCFIAVRYDLTVV